MISTPSVSTFQLLRTTLLDGGNMLRSTRLRPFFTPLTIRGSLLFQRATTTTPVGGTTRRPEGGVSTQCIDACDKRTGCVDDANSSRHGSYCLSTGIDEPVILGRPPALQGDRGSGKDSSDHAATFIPIVSQVVSQRNRVLKQGRSRRARPRMPTVAPRWAWHHRTALR